MRVSNSKLTKTQKAWLKATKASNPNIFFVYSELSGATLCVRPTVGDMGVFTTSIAAPDEVRVRRKVGEYHALQRMAKGLGQPINLANSCLQTVANYLA
jgi:hypothetical protein